jgi:hypothetical protein
MRRNPADFNQASIDQVRTRVAQIPAVRMDSKALDGITIILEQFYIRPTEETYGYLKDVYKLYIRTWLASSNELFGNIAGAYMNTLSGLNQGLAQKVDYDRRASSNIVLSREQQQILVNLQQ